MTHYTLFSKIILTLCLCGVLLAAVNGLTGFINSAVSSGGTAVCMAGFIVAGAATVLLDQARMRKAKP